MTCTEFNRRIADYLSGEGAMGDRRAMQEHAAACAACRRELEEVDEMWGRIGVLADERPGPVVRARFYAMLETEARRLETASPAARPLWRLSPAALRLAAGLLLFAVGIGAGLWLRPAAAGSDVRQLRGEVDGLRRTLASTLIAQESASDRLRGVYLISRQAEADPDAVRSLLQVLDSDANVNLRLSALDSLAPLADRPAVRAALLASLERQTSPLLQVNLAGLLARRPDRDTTARLQRLAGDPRLQPDVRDHLRSVLQTSI